MQNDREGRNGPIGGTRAAWRRIARYVLLVQLLVHIVIGIAGAQTQTQGEVNVQQRMAVDDLGRRLTVLENVQTPERLRVLESDMTELKWLARGAAAGVVGQLILGLGWGLRPRRPEASLEP